MDDDNKLIDLIYKAALDTESWYPLLDLLGEKLAVNMHLLSDVSDQQETFSTLISHFQNAIRLSEKDQHLQSNRDTLATVLNQLPIAVIIVKSDGGIVRQNKHADVMLKNQRILQADQHGLINIFGQPQQTQTLRDKIEDIAAAPENITATLKLPLVNATIALAPADAISESIAHDDHLVSLFIAAIDVQKDISLSWLEQHYGLIPSEARLLCALLRRANTLTEAADELHISRETARSYLKNIFATLGVHSQVELIKKVRLDAPVNLVEEQSKSDISNSNVYKVHLRDDRVLAYAEYGAQDGYPVFVFHPFSGSRLLVHPDHSIAKRLGIRLISPDRPGFGQSDPMPNRGFLDCANDIDQLADHLEIKLFSLLGYAGGCPYALAVAHKLANRVERVALTSCMSPLQTFQDTEGMHPLNRLTIQIARKTPAVARQSIRLMLLAMNQAPEQYFNHVTQYLGNQDKQTINQSEIVSTYIAAAQEAMHQGGASIADEIIRFVHPWDFDYTDIQADTCLWHGTEDRHIPIRLAKRMAEAIPNCETKFYDELGYYIYFDKWEEILSFLVNKGDEIEN